jgi:hypothetical protein
MKTMTKNARKEYLLDLMHGIGVVLCDFRRYPIYKERTGEAMNEAKKRKHLAGLFLNNALPIDVKSWIELSWAFPLALGFLTTSDIGNRHIADKHLISNLTGIEVEYLIRKFNELAVKSKIYDEWTIVSSERAEKLVNKVKKLLEKSEPAHA